MGDDDWLTRLTRKMCFYLSFNVLSSSSPPRTRIPREFNLCNVNTAKSLVISFVYSAIQSPYQSSAHFFSCCCHPRFSSFTKMSSILSQKSRQSNNTRRSELARLWIALLGELCNNFSFLLRPMTKEEVESMWLWLIRLLSGRNMSRMVLRW